MKKLKRLSAVLTAAVMCVCTLSACGSSDSSSSSSGTADSDSVPDSSGSVLDEPADGTLYKSPYDTQMEFRDITAWELSKEMVTGWNLGNTMDAVSNNTVMAEISWQGCMTTKGLFDKLSESGFNVVRIPVSWGYHMDENYNVDPAWMARVREIVDYGIANDMYVILNTHHEEWYFPTEENKEQDIEQLKALWAQIAEEFKNYDEHLIFEGLNEPRLRDTSMEWNGGNKESHEIVNEYEKAFYETVRSSGGNNDKRMLMITGYAASSMRSCLKDIWLPENDRNIFVSVHAYLPYSMALDTKGTDQFDDGNKGEIDTFFKTLAELFYLNEIPVIVGEYGSVNKDNTEERVECVKYYLETAKNLGIPCIWWDNNAVVGNGENFGIISREAPYDWRFPEIVEAIMSVYSE